MELAVAQSLETGCLIAAMAKDAKWNGPEWTKTWSMSDQRFNQKDWALHTVSLNLEEGTFTERWRKKTKTKFGDDEKKPKKTSQDRQGQNEEASG